MRVKKVLTVLFMVTALVFGVSASPQAAIPPEGQMGLQVVESTIATLMSQLQNTLDKPENFEAVSGMEALIEAIQNGTADQTLLNQFTQAGVLFQEAQDNPEQVTPMNLSVAQAIVLLIDQLLQNQNLDSQIVVFLEELKKLAEGSVEGYHNPGATDPEFDPLNGPSADGGRDPFGSPASGPTSTEPNCCSHKLLEMMWTADQDNPILAHFGRIRNGEGPSPQEEYADSAWIFRPPSYRDDFRYFSEPFPGYIKSDLRDDVQAALLSSDIRQKDAFFTENSDAKAGRVMTDRHGQTTRVEQYVLRPNSDTVQVLNVTFRENGNHAGMSTIDWKTRFAASIDGVDLKTLPWHEYLTTKSIPGIVRWIDNSGSIPLSEMSVQFTNPDNEWLMEYRFFFPTIVLGAQTIHTEYLAIYRNWSTVTDVEASGYQAITFKRALNLLSLPLPGENYYFTVDNGNGFTYKTTQKTAFSGTQEMDIGVELFTTSGDAVNADDIWGALNANGANGAGPTIGAGDGLEITIDSAGNFFNNPIDVIYLPMMTHLEWR